MHRGHDHDHHHHGNGAAAGHNHATPPRAVQWQTPHLPHDHVHEDHHPHEPDLDLVEMAFVEGFAATKDPASFLRLARIPFEATDSGRHQAGAAAGRERSDHRCRHAVAAARRRRDALRPAAGAHGHAPAGARLRLFRRQRAAAC